MSLANNPSFSAKTILRHFAQEDGLSHHRFEFNQKSSSAFIAHDPTHAKPRPVCTNCKKSGHEVTYCIQPGGKMASCSIDDACNTQRAAQGKPPQTNSSTKTPTSSAHVATSVPMTSSTTPNSVVVGGITYYSSPPAQSSACLAIPQHAHIETLDSDSKSVTTSLASFCSYMVLTGPLTTLVDFTLHHRDVDCFNSVVALVLTKPACALVAHLADCPFTLDSGASAHISPECSDFCTLRPIAPYPIQGFNGSSTFATGIGNIDLCIASRHKLTLKDVLYMPSCLVRLVSVKALAHHSQMSTYFGPEGCYVTDKSKRIIIRGSESETNGLYILNCSTAKVTHTRPPVSLCKSMATSSSSALVTSAPSLPPDNVPTPSSSAMYAK